MTQRIFVTGGAGYIGSHTCYELLTQNHEVMVYDSMINGYQEALLRVEALANKKLTIVVGDIRDKVALQDAMYSFKPNSVIHFAGLKAVSDSVDDPLQYYDVNVCGSVNVLQSMEEVGCNEIVFSSSATVYGDSCMPPYSETHDILPISPYGRAKHNFENILADWVESNKAYRALILRYFNPVGAHPSGLIGEDPRGNPTNLMPVILQVAQKKREYLSIYGSDYDTRDGTGERDYIHVTDLAIGHAKALEHIANLERFQILNLGTGRGTTVRELKEAFERMNAVSIEERLVGRRAGDVAKSYADSRLARKLIGFECKKSIDEMCFDTWNWQIKNPNGYGS